jgi:CubicO group peptidase (beta-lactamase class C family)
MPANPPEGVPQIHPRLAHRDPTKAAPAKTLASLLLALTFCFGGCAHLHREASVQQEASIGSSEGFSEERAARITAGMKAYTDAGDVAGVVTLVQRDGVIVHSDVLGYRDREARVPMTRDTIFRIYSMSKPITSVAVMMLLEEGKLRLTDPVDTLLPELADPVVLIDPAGPLDQTTPARGPITIRDLLTHTSGLAYTFTAGEPLAKALSENGLLGSSSDLGPDEWMERLGSLPLAYQPGSRWHYSLSTDVLGVVVERASGMPFAEFLQTRLFEPLGMPDTAFYVPPEKLDRFATHYTRDPTQDGKVVVFDHPSQSSYAAPQAFSSGGGGLVSTADDYLRFATMIAQGGELDGVRILSRKGVELMTTNALTEEEKPEAPFGARFFAAGRGFGMGVSVVEDVGLTASLGSPGNNGWGGAAGTWYWVDFEEDLVAVMMIQLMGAGQQTPIRNDFETLVYQALE